MIGAWRGPFGITARHCLRTVTLPTLLATALALLAHATTSPSEPALRSAAACTPWLTLPLCVAAIGCSLVAAHLWPTFALRRPGADVVRRLCAAPLRAHVAVVLAAACAQLVLVVPLTIALSWWFGVPPLAQSHRVPTGPAEALLLEDGSRLTFRLEPPGSVQQIWLRPRASLPTGPEATRLRLDDLDGGPLAATPIALSESYELLRVPINVRELAGFTLTRVGGDVPLLFADDGVLAVGPPRFARWLNAVLAALSTLVPTLTSMAVAAALGRFAGWPTLAACITCAQAVQWIVGVGPVDETLLDLVRGIWLG